jgi:hypothetical protein
MKHIIVDGPNCCGKSYFIKKLLSQEKFKDYEKEHLSCYTPNTLEFHKDLLNYDRPMLFDRFCIDETVYPYIFNREPKMTHKEVFTLLEKYADDIVLIFIDADYDFIVRAHKNKNEEFDYKTIRAEKDYFYLAYKQSLDIKNLQVYRFKNTKENEEEFNEFINKIVNEVGE